MVAENYEVTLLQPWEETVQSVYIHILLVRLALLEEKDNLVVPECILWAVMLDEQLYGEAGSSRQRIYPVNIVHDEPEV